MLIRIWHTWTGYYVYGLDPSSRATLDYTGPWPTVRSALRRWTDGNRYDARAERLQDNSLRLAGRRL